MYTHALYMQAHIHTYYKDRKGREIKKGRVRDRKGEEEKEERKKKHSFTNNDCGKMF